MKQLSTLNSTLSIVLLALTATAVGAEASSSQAFDELMKPYEKIRLALLADSTEGVAGEAEALAEKAKENAEEAATPAGIKALLPEIAGFAEDLAEAADLTAARGAFSELSKLMVRYRSQVEGERPVVVYCPMVKKSWLQPDGEIGNPYSGSAMASCGEVVER